LELAVAIWDSNEIEEIPREVRLKKALKTKNGPDGHGFFHPKPKLRPRAPGSPASTSSKKTVRFEVEGKRTKPVEVPARPAVPARITPYASPPARPPRQKVRPTGTETRASPPLDFEQDFFGPTVGWVRPSNRPRTGAGSSTRELSLPGTARPATTDSSSTVPENTKFHRVSPSVINSPSVTPPPSVSTVPNTAVQPKRARAEGPSASKISALRSKVVSQTTITPDSLITPATLVPPQVTKKNARPDLAPYSHSAPASASSLLLDVQMKDYGSMTDPFNYMKDTVMTGTAAIDNTASSSSAHLSQSNSAWNKRNPLSPREIMLRPLNIELPEPKEDEALFLPRDADRLWYLGYLKPWTEFNDEAIKFWKNKKIRGAFDDIKAYPIWPSAPDSDITTDSRGSEILYSEFRGEVLDVMQNVFNKLMELSRLQSDNVPDEMFPGAPDEEDIGNDDMGWEPSYIIKTSGGGNDEAVRILGQAEYLGGRKDALTWAIKEVSKNAWGSLRCVLGMSSPSRTLEHTDMSPTNRRHLPVYAHVVEQVRFRGVRR
jgi:hypothetical protein